MKEKVKAGPFRVKRQTAEKMGRTQRYGLQLVLAFGGAILFGFPVLMTMEVWWLGFYIDRIHLALFVVIGIPVLVRLSYRAGLDRNHSYRDSILDAFSACTVGFCVSAFMLVLFGVLKGGMSMYEVVGKITIQAVPAAVGAMLAGSLIGSEPSQPESKRSLRYLDGLFLMAVGSIVLALAIAPTEEMIVIAFRMSELGAFVLALLSIAIMHAFVSSDRFQSHALVPVEAGHVALFFRYTLVGYAIALLFSVLVLWLFQRLHDVSFLQNVVTTVVLAFPATLGAATARSLL